MYLTAFTAANRSAPFALSISLAARATAARRNGVRFAVFLLAVAATLLTPAVWAEHERDFSAIYDLKSVSTVDPRRVSLTLVLQLHNHSGGDISNGVVALSDPLRPGKQTAEISRAVSLKNRGHVKVSGHITVERSEYERWRRGALFPLIIEFKDTNGRTITRPIEVVRMPGIGAMP